MGTHPIFESDFDCLTDSQIGCSNGTIGPRSTQKEARRLPGLSRQKGPRPAERQASRSPQATCYHQARCVLPKAYANEERLEITRKRQAKKNGNIYVPGEPKLALVVRIRGINQVSPRVKKILQLLRLRQIGNAVFVKLNQATVMMLNIAQPYITWGYPNVKTVKELMYKRGHGKVNGQRIPFTDNAVIEGSLGSLGIQSIEDLIHEIYSVGPNFKRANNFLWPFKLSTPTGGYRRVNNHFVEGGDFGNREDKINNLVRRMN